MESTVNYHADDLYVGSKVDLNRHKFVLIDTDEYSLRYMERHCQQFPYSNIVHILSKLGGPASEHISSVKKAFLEADHNNLGRLPFDQFRMLVCSLSQGLLNDHEVLTLARHYGEKKFPCLFPLIRLIQDNLRKQNFTAFEELSSALSACDCEEVGFISARFIRDICHEAQLPLSDQLIDGTIMNCETSITGAVNYEQFVQLLNWRDHPLPQEGRTKAITGSTGSWSGGATVVTSIDYNTLLSDLAQ